MTDRLSATMVDRLQARGIRVVRDPDRTKYACYLHREKTIVIGAEMIRPHVELLLHEAAHVYRFEVQKALTVAEYFLVERRAAEEILVDSAATLAAFILTGECAADMAARYAYGWATGANLDHAFPEIPAGESAPPSSDDADRLAGEVLAWLGFADAEVAA